MKKPTDHNETDGDQIHTFLGLATFLHSQYSGFENVLFYQDRQGELLYQVEYVDPFDSSNRGKELRPCPLKEREVERLIKEKVVTDYKRFYNGR